MNETNSKKGGGDRRTLNFVHNTQPIGARDGSG